MTKLLTLSPLAGQSGLFASRQSASMRGAERESLLLMPTAAQRVKVLRFRSAPVYRGMTGLGASLARQLANLQDVGESGEYHREGRSRMYDRLSSLPLHYRNLSKTSRSRRFSNALGIIRFHANARDGKRR